MSKKPWLSLLIPSNRSAGLLKFKDSLEMKALSPSSYQYVIGLDEGSERANLRGSEYPQDKSIFVEKGISIPQIFGKLIEEADGEWIWFLNDDVLMETDGWDVKLHGLLEGLKDPIHLLHVKENLFGQMLCTFPLISKVVGSKLNVGELPYKRYKLDDHIHELFARLGRIHWVPQVSLFHDHLDEAPASHGFNFPIQGGGYYVLDPLAARADSWNWQQTEELREQTFIQLEMMKL